jgi:hypothetical protein
MTTAAPPLLPEAGQASQPQPTRSSSGRQHWRGSRGVLAIAGALVIVCALALLVQQSQSSTGTMDPASYEPSGARALATLLANRGMSVQRLDTIGAVLSVASAAGDGVTVVVADPAGEGDVTALRGLPQGSSVVLIDPDQASLSQLQPGIVLGGSIALRRQEPDCAAPDAVLAGDVISGGSVFLAAPPAALPGASCYAETLYQQATSGGGSLIDVGSAETLSNAELGREGNAALGLGLLGHNRTVLWLVPGPLTTVSGTKSIGELLPGRLKAATLQALLAVGLLMLWRARRLGRVVPERLPVSVRASETVEGQGRLYRAAGARRRAASALRTATLTRLAPRLGLRRDEGVAAMVDAVAARTGRPASGITTLLYGAEPEDDRALVTLADQLDALETEVRRS